MECDQGTVLKGGRRSLQNQIHFHSPSAETRTGAHLGANCAKTHWLCILTQSVTHSRMSPCVQRETVQISHHCAILTDDDCDAFFIREEHLQYINLCKCLSAFESLNGGYERLPGCDSLSCRLWIFDVIDPIQVTVDKLEESSLNCAVNGFWSQL